MSDDQSDFTGKPRHRTAVMPDGQGAQEKQEARKQKAAKNSGSKAARGVAAAGVSTPDPIAENNARLKAARKTVKKVAKKAEINAGRAKGVTEESATAPGDEEKAKSKAARKAEKAARKSEAKAARKSAVVSDAVPALSEEEKAKAKAERKAEKAASKSEAKTERKKAAAVADAAPTLSDEDKAKAKAERKAEKAARKSEAKAARKSAVVSDAAPALSEEEKAKAKAERKAEKAASKSEAKAERKKAAAIADAAPTLSDEDKAKAKAERKAEKAARKSEAKAARKSAVVSDAAPALSEEEKAKAKAERKAEKAAKRGNAKALRGVSVANDSAPALNDEEKARAKAERKVQKAARKAEAGRHKEAAAGVSVSTLTDEEKAKAKAERKAAKAAKKTERKSREGDSTNDVVSDRRKRRSEGEDDVENADGAHAFQVALHGLSENTAARLRGYIETILTAASVPFEWAKDGEKSSLAIYGFENPPAGPEDIASRIGDIAKARAKYRIFVGRAPATDGSNPFAAENNAIAMLAADGEDAFVDVVSLFQRYELGALMENDQPTDAGCDLIAAAVLAIAASRRMAKGTLPYPPHPVPSDLTAARALAPADILSQLSWNDPSPPKLLWTHASKESVEAFMDGKIALSPEQTLDLNFPISWPAELADRASGIQALGLEFLSGPLNYWYARAGTRSTEQIAEIDTFLKERGATAGEILARAGKIIVDFADNHPLSNSAAWEERAVSRRARVLALFVLCCKMASKRKVKFDEAVFVRVFGELLNLIELLRSDDFYTPGSFDGVQQDSLLIGLALTLRRTAYAELLLKESIARLIALQLNVGLTGDGVWRTGPFSDHCSLLSQFKIMIVDFDKADMALIEPVALAAKKMTVFAEAMLKSGGAPPSFDDSHDKSVLRKLSGTRRALAGAGFSKSAPQRGKPMPRVTDTYVFRDAQYFASHSTQKAVSDSSLVILHAEPASGLRQTPGGIVLAFAYADTDLLIRVEPPEGTKRRDKAAHQDPALRNGYHINHPGDVAKEEIELHAARLTKSWRGPGWAAAKSIDGTNPAGSVSRVVLHLKEQHALVVVDELMASDGAEAAFEQFWHVAPGFSPTESDSAPLRLSASEGGLTIAFDALGTTAIEPEGEGGHCVRRTMRLAKGVVASLFQWTGMPVPTVLKVESAAPGDWSIALSGGGFDARLSLTGDDLRYEPQTAD